MISQERLEEGALHLLCFSIEHSPFLALKVTPDLFAEGPNRLLAKTALAYISKYHNPPANQLEILLEVDLRRGAAGQLLGSTIELLRNLKPDSAFILEELDNFIQNKNFRNSCIRALELVDANQLTEAREALHKQTILPLQGTAGILLQNPKQSLSFLDANESEEFFSSAISVLDIRGVRPKRKTISFMIAASGKGKCVAGDELILLPNGSRIPIKEAVRNKIPEVISYSENCKQLITTKVLGHWENGKKECFTLTTKTGRKITATKEHKFLTQSGWKELQNIKPENDMIVVPHKLENLGTNTVSSEEVRLLAYLIAEGGLTAGITFTNEDIAIQKDFERCVNFFGDNVSSGKRLLWEEGFVYVVNRDENAGKHVSKIKKLLRDTGLLGKKSSQKRIPDYIFNLTDDLIAEFLRILFSCDGSIYSITNNVTIELNLSSSRLVEDIQFLLMRLGIISRVRYYTAKYKEKTLPGYAFLTIQTKYSVLKFVNKIGFFGEKEKRVQEFIKINSKPIMATRTKSGNEVAYTLAPTKFSYINKNGKFVSYIRQGTIKYRTKTTPVLYEVPQAFPGRCKRISESAFFDTVAKVESAGEKETYDLTVDINSNYVVSNIITHNSFWLVNVGKSGLQFHHKVLHITLELSEEQTAGRYIQAIFSLTKEQVEQIRVPYFTKNESGGTVIEFAEFERKSVRVERNTLEKRLREMGSYPPLIIKEFPTSSFSVEQLYMYLDSLEQEKNFRPDLLIIDYADLMKIDAQSLRIDTGRLYRELRGLAVSRNLALVTATQGNRESESAKVVGSTNVAEDWSKIGTSDNVLTYSQTPQEYQLGLARIFVAKSREASDRFMTLIAQSYRIGQFCLDAAPMNAAIVDQISQISGA